MVNMPHGAEGEYRPRDERHQPPRKSFTASDSSLEEALGEDDDTIYQKRRRSRRSKILRQKRSLTNEDGDIALYYQTDEDTSPQGYHNHGHVVKGTLRLPLSAGGMRHIASETTLFVDSGQGGTVRRQSDSSDRSERSDL